MSADNEPEAVLLLAHGSRVEASNSEVEALARRLAERLAPRTRVAHAFLELTTPSIPEAIDALVRDGARRIRLVPYFLSAGRHVADDIPAIAERARARHPHVRISITDHFGARQEVVELLAAMAGDEHTT